jgi:cytochrome c553
VKRFIAGFLTGAAFLVLLVVLIAQLGLVDVRADAAIPSWFATRFSASVHRSVARQASSVSPLAPATDADVIAGGKLYLNDCVGCHGEPGKPQSDFGATFYPPAPQLATTGTTYTEAQIYWVAKQGIRRTGMGAQAGSYSDEKLRLLAAFIYRMRTLPRDILKEIQPKPEPPAQKAEPQK